MGLSGSSEEDITKNAFTQLDVGVFLRCCGCELKLRYPGSLQALLSNDYKEIFQRFPFERNKLRLYTAVEKHNITSLGAFL